MKWIFILAFLLWPRPAQAQEKWLYTAMVASDVADIESTFYVKKHNPNITEGNPLGVWFIDHGRVATYTYHFALDGVVIWASHKTHQKWLPGLLIGAHAVAITWNLKHLGG